MLQIYPHFHLQLSESSETDSSDHPGHDSDSEGSVTSEKASASELTDTCRKRPRRNQHIPGMSGSFVDL